MGYDTLKDDQNKKTSLIDRMKYKARPFGFTDHDYSSIYSPSEQSSMATSDARVNKIVRNLDMITGLGTIGVGAIGGGKLSGGLGWGSLAAHLTGHEGVGSFLGTASMAMNPKMMLATLGLKAGIKGLQHSFVNPLVESMGMTSSAHTSTRRTVGGFGSNTGYGGLSLGQSYQIGNIGNSLKEGSGLSSESMNDFIKLGASLPQMAGLDSKKAVENMSQLMTVMTGLAKAFKGRERELGESMRQFSSMGMGVSQAGNAILQTSRVGVALGVDPSRIMAAGAEVAAGMMGSNISQSTGYYLGAQAFVNSTAMLQRGQFSKTQLLNFGGAEGISRTVAASQLGILGSKEADLYFKSMYSVNGNEGSINSSARDRMLNGEMGIREAQFRSQNITLSPKSNMMYQFDKNSIISSLGDRAADASEHIYNQMMTRNPYGQTLQGQAKYLMKRGLANSNDQAMLIAQQHMSYNPTFLKASQEGSELQRAAGGDMYFSSRNSTFAGINQTFESIDRFGTSVSRDSPIGYFRGDTNKGRRLWSGVGDLLTFGQSRNWIRGIQDISTNKLVGNPADTFRDMTVEKLQELRSVKGERVTPEESARREIGRLALGNYDQLEIGTDRDIFSGMEKQVRSKLVESGLVDFGLNGYIANKDAVSGLYKNPVAYEKKMKEMSAEILSKNASLRGVDFTTKDGRKISGSDQITNMLINMSSERNPEVLDDAKESLVLSETMINTKLKSTNKIFTENIFSGALNKIGFGNASLNKVLWSSPYSMISNITGKLVGDSANSKTLEELTTKFNSSDTENKTRIINRLKEYQKGNYNGSVNSEDMALFGISNADVAGDVINTILEDGQLEKSLEFANSPEGILRQKSKNLRTGVDSLFKTTSFKETFSRFGNANLGAALVKRALFANSEVDKGGDGRISEDMWKKLKDSNIPGFDGILKFATRDEDGEVMFDEKLHSTRAGKNALGKFIGKHGGGIEGTGIQSASQLWNDNRHGEAKTIQDFAVAVSKGMGMAGLGKGSNGDLTSYHGNYNPTIADKGVENN